MKIVELTPVDDWGEEWAEGGSIAFPLDQITAVVTVTVDGKTSTEVYAGATRQRVAESYDVVLSRIGAQR
ncbi:hypothetical protein SEA_JKSYNGBOY_71 [Gordonia phage JKSyngboy]|uniref:Uncharacterized protein n=1 Tax=Gordonia phage JKSyngboy TaxID=2762400 RepID=A0A7G8LLC3_9CAUD|nr:hypothetical protein J1762_gp71 [Gordonia phage JKSyngboy]QNJ58045.1 hypothetical protein SEA_JKSYNGBOY_71 [Gordonia phage JKSyngboy]